MVIRPHTGGRHGECGTSMIELVVTSTVFSIVMACALASSGSFSATLEDQMNVQNQFTSANVTRVRLLGDADSSTSVSCLQPDYLMFAMANPSGAFVGYTSRQGKLLRYNSRPDHWSILTDSAPSLTCNDLGADGVYVGIELGTDDLPYHLHVRISAGGGGA